MPTGEQTAADKAWVEAQGYSVALLDKDRAREDWYRPDGLRIPGLPVDTYHRDLYRRKGWFLKAPSAEEIAAWRVNHPETASVGVAPLSPELQKELAEVTGTALAPPPKHVHVYQEAIGSPCLVLGCGAVRKNEKPTMVRKNKRTTRKGTQKPKEGA